MDFLKTPEMRLNRGAKIQEIIDEMNLGVRDDVAWAKALKNAKGNVSYAEALYIDERIQRVEDGQYVAAIQKKVLLKDLEGELDELEKSGSRSRILFCVVTLCLIFSVFLFWEGNVELAYAVGLVACGFGIFSTDKISRLDKQQEEIKLQIDALSPPHKRSSGLGLLVILTALAAAVAWLWA